MVSQSHSDDECRALRDLITLCSTSDTTALLIYKILGRLARYELRIEKLEKELERLKND